jgi:hypothetical protein
MPISENNSLKWREEGIFSLTVYSNKNKKKKCVQNKTERMQLLVKEINTSEHQKLTIMYEDI